MYRTIYDTIQDATEYKLGEGHAFSVKFLNNPKWQDLNIDAVEDELLDWLKSPTTTILDDKEIYREASTLVHNYKAERYVSPHVFDVHFNNLPAKLPKALGVSHENQS